MTTHADIFFIISSIGFVIIGILLIIGLVYFIKTMRTISEIIKNAKRGIDDISNSGKDMLLDIQDSTVYRMLFGRKSRRKTSDRHDK